MSQKIEQLKAKIKVAETQIRELTKQLKQMDKATAKKFVKDYAESVAKPKLEAQLTKALAEFEKVSQKANTKFQEVKTQVKTIIEVERNKRRGRS